MKKFETPEIMIAEFAVADILTVSGNCEDWNVGEEEL